MSAGGRRRGTGSKAHVYTGLRQREVNGPAECLAAAIVLGGIQDWESGRADREELAAFFQDPLCEYLADAGGLSYHEVLRRTVQQLEG